MPTLESLRLLIDRSRFDDGEGAFIDPKLAAQNILDLLKELEEIKLEAA